MRRLLVLAALALLAGCHSAPRDPQTVVFLIESSPANLDPRIGTDAQSQRIDAIMFDGLVDHNANFQFIPALATSWDQPDPHNADLSPPLWGALPRWASTDLARRSVDHQLDPDRRGHLAQSRRIRFRRFDRSSRPAHGRLSSETCRQFPARNLSTGAIRRGSRGQRSASSGGIRSAPAHFAS